MKPDMRDLLPKLRQIGFGSWDPLGLSKTWADGEAMADEYDRFLISALGKAVNRGGADCRERAAREILEFACRHAVG